MDPTIVALPGTGVKASDPSIALPAQTAVVYPKSSRDIPSDFAAKGGRFMKPRNSRSRPRNRIRSGLAAVCCAAVLLSGENVLLAQPAPTPAPAPAGAAEASAPVIPPEKLDALVAPIALYPDPLLAQTLVASTYPLEIVQLQQWLAKNKDLKDKALADAVAKQPWDPAVQSMAAVPDVVKRLADDIQWATELGNAFLGQQSDVMDAVQRMRQKAQGTGALKSNDQQKVETKVVETQTIIVVEPANPEVVYVPSYSPVAVYGPAFYPYPPIYYPPPPPPGAAFVSFSAGVMVGAAIWGGSCCNMRWGPPPPPPPRGGHPPPPPGGRPPPPGGGNSVTLNNKNTYVNQSQARGNAGQSGGNSWQHDPQHRGGAPYPGGKPPSGSGGSGASNRPTGGASAGQQPAGRPPSGAGGGSYSGGSRSPSAGTGSYSGGAKSPSYGTGSYSGGAKSSSYGTGSYSGGSKSTSGGSKSYSSGSFSGGSSGYSGSSAKASSSRGASSMSSSRGASRSGGGGSRGGGGGRR